jgi:hypothetical protein
MTRTHVCQLPFALHDLTNPQQSMPIATAFSSKAKKTMKRNMKKRSLLSQNSPLQAIRKTTVLRKLALHQNQSTKPLVRLVLQNPK